ncbi:MAG: glycosyltransferase, partial [Duncaniella sp.]|nr:glycosyltransferase [Duncaniella sp.]
MKQRVLLVNKFYYRRGGDCVYLLNLEKILRDNGHEVAVYAMDYPHNITSEWSDYFASEISFQGGPIHKLMAAGRALGLGDINKSFNAMLDKFRPDVVHFNNIHSYLSPRIVQLAHRRAIRTVWTMHDYKLLCPSYSCLHDGKICESCIGRDKKYVLKNRCMKGSLAASVIAMIEAGRWTRNTLPECTDTFICPSEFIASKMRQDGFPDDKIVTLNNFIDPAIDVSTRIFSQKRDDYYVYIGRLSEEKG